jgi:hypothetical protein
VENLLFAKVFHSQAEISTAISTGAVENKSTGYNIKVGFPHFHRPYYYY